MRKNFRKRGHKDPGRTRLPNHMSGHIINYSCDLLTTLNNSTITTANKAVQFALFDVPDASFYIATYKFFKLKWVRVQVWTDLNATTFGSYAGIATGAIQTNPVMPNFYAIRCYDIGTLTTPGAVNIQLDETHMEWPLKTGVKREFWIKPRAQAEFLNGAGVASVPTPNRWIETSQNPTNHAGLVWHVDGWPANNPEVPVRHLYLKYTYFFAFKQRDS